MARKSMSVGRLLALPLVGAHLLLAGAAVPHCHERAAGAGPVNAAGQQHRHRQPHRHWAWAGHGHTRDRHVDRADGLPFVPVDHDGDAIYLAHAFLAAEPGQWELAPWGAMPWAAMPPQAPRNHAAEPRPPGRFVRPPGEGLPTFHDLLPHVLRV